MSTGTRKEKEKAFYLHSSQNRRLYPASDYPITHLLDRFKIKRRLLIQPSYVYHFKYAFILLLLFIFIGTIFFQLHIQVYNLLCGPFHLNREQFIEHVNQYKNDQFLSSWLWKVEYVQVELGENNIQNPNSTYETIRQFSDPTTRRNRIATYKQIKHPSIYVKLPTSSRKNFHARLPFQFQSYPIRTLQCIVRNLPSSTETTYRTWIEKSDYVEHINREYARNSTEFNKAVLTKCGVLIGYLYRPVTEQAFTPTRKYNFTTDDVALNATKQYYSLQPFLICGLIFVWLFLKALFYFILYLSNIIRFKFLHKYGLLSLPLELLPAVTEELWLLNIDGSPHEQLLELDDLVRQSQNKLSKQIIIVKNDDDQRFVIMFKINLEEELDVEDESSPFVICPVTDIRKITESGGICYGQDSSWIPWSVTTTDEQNYSAWLHEELMDISDIYRERYDERLQFEQEVDQPSNSPGLFLRPVATVRNAVRHRWQGMETTTEHESRLTQLIQEEENFQRLKLERQSFIENFENLIQPITPAASQFIAEFRMEHERHINVVDEAMLQEEITCIVCCLSLKVEDQYARWPCSDTTQHVFHYDCMLKSLRTKNTCPLCRHEVEGVPLPSTQAVIGRFLSRLVF